MLICLLYFALLLLPRLCRCRAVAMSPSQQGKATRCSRVLSLASSELPLKAAVLRAWACWHHGAPRQVSLGGLQNAAEASVQSPLAPCSGFGVRSNGLGRKSMVCVLCVLPPRLAACAVGTSAQPYPRRTVRTCVYPKLPEDFSCSPSRCFHASCRPA